MTLNTWLNMRVSGALLVLAFMIHLLENFFLGKSFMPQALAFVVNLGIVGFAISHGLAGVKRVIDDQDVSPRAQTATTWVLVALGLVSAYFAASAMQRFGLL